MFGEIHFAPSKGKPIGEPFRVTTFESLRLMIPQQIYRRARTFAQPEQARADDAGALGQHQGAG